MIQYRYSIGDRAWTKWLGDCIITDLTSSIVYGPAYYVKSIKSSERGYYTERELIEYRAEFLRLNRDGKNRSEL